MRGYGLFTSAGRNVLAGADEEAGERGVVQVDTLLLLSGLHDEHGQGRDILRELVDLDIFQYLLEGDLPHRSPVMSGPVWYSSEVKEVLTRAVNEALLLGHPQAGSGHVLLALAGADTAAAELLKRCGITHTAVREELLKSILPPRSTREDRWVHDEVERTFAPA